MDKEKTGSNRLAGESSPYLLQHAGNPVDWYPWGKEAFDRAAREIKPVFLSIGYSACHWCHVMAHESFEDRNIADYLNQNFISIKVDREERPDLDHVYMQAVQALTGSGGWPLSVFLTPSGVPFYGGTYFPPRDAHGLPGFYQVLKAIKNAFDGNITDVESQAAELQSALRKVHAAKITTSWSHQDTLSAAYRNLVKEFDHVNGGFGGAPKFPEPLAVEFLLRFYFRSGDRDALKMADLTLTKMAQGGIFDQLGGGFHRYSTDNIWCVPHFEKMLYDNALLSSLYVHGYQATRDSKYRDVACSILDYLLREMHAAEGAFYSAQDADTEGVEGKYYIWTKAEIEQAAGKDAELFNRSFGVSGSGNFEGHNILTSVGITGSQMSPQLLGVKSKLLEVRGKRVRPQRDEKILASWNGLMISSLAEAAATFANKEYLEAATSCAEFITGLSGVPGILAHTSRDGTPGKNSFLEDYACVIQGLLDLHAATCSVKWLETAVKLAGVMTEMFLDKEDGLLYDTANDGEPLFLRPRNLIDGSTPSGNSSAAGVLLRLHDLTGDQAYGELAARMLTTMQGKMVDHPRGFANWLCALDYYAYPRLEIAVCGNGKEGELGEFIRAIYDRYLPNKIVAAQDEATGERVSGIALLEGRHPVQGRTTAYICSNNTCKAPITGVEMLVSELSNHTFKAYD